MSGAMMDALKKKRMGDMGTPGLISESGGADSDSGGGMHDLVQSLSPEQKQELMQLLTKDAGSKGSDSSQIAKGAPSDEERSKIEARMGDENDGSVPDSDDESDEIGMSMLSSADKAQAGVERPSRSLGDRVRMNLASKLKSKGKL